MNQSAAGPGSLSIEPPLRLSHVDEVNWDQTTEVLVIGFGAAGAATALSAAEQGRQVLLVDRFDPGGATARSGGVVYAGGGTPQQLQAGFADTPQAMFDYLSREVGTAVGPDTLRRFCEDSRGLLAWLEGLGAEFRSHSAPPKTSYPKNGVYLYYSGNESVSGFKEYAEPAPRGHRTVDKGLSGHRLFSVLRAAVERAGIPVLAQASARRLIAAPDGSVLGVEIWRLPPATAVARRHARLMSRAEQVHNFAPAWADRLRRQAQAIETAHAAPLRIRATAGVALTTGGFIFNREMLGQHAPKYLANMRLGTTGCDGSGIRLGQSVGGAVGQMHKVSAWRFINPPTPWVEGVAVNQQGERFCNEASYGARLGVEMCEQAQGRAWLIMDKAQRRRAYREALFGGLWIFQRLPALLLMLLAPKASKLSALANKIGMPEDALQATVDACNQAAAGARADSWGKAAPALQALSTPPYAAINISVDNPLFPCPAITLGGLRVDESSGAVLGEDGQVIPGLFAAGRAAVGIASNGYVSGLSLADCLWSGRRAGRAIAALKTPAAQAA